MNEEESLVKEREQGKVRGGGFLNNMPPMKKYAWFAIIIGLGLYWWKLGSSANKGILIAGGVILLALAYESHKPKTRDYDVKELMVLGERDLKYFRGNYGISSTADIKVGPQFYPIRTETDGETNISSYKIGITLREPTGDKYGSVEMDRWTGRMIRYADRTTPLKGDEEADINIVFGKDLTTLLQADKQAREQHGRGLMGK